MAEVIESSPMRVHQSRLLLDDGDESDMTSLENGHQGIHEHTTTSEPMEVGDSNGHETSDLSQESKSSPRQSRSPRCEAFVMTGSKMLNLNPKISPCYAKMCQDQLPPSVETACTTSDVAKKRGPFDDFPSMHHRSHKKMPRTRESDKLSDVTITNGEESEPRYLAYPGGSLGEIKNLYLAEEAPYTPTDEFISKASNASESKINARNSEAESCSASPTSKSTPSSPSKQQIGHDKDRDGQGNRLLPIRVGSSLSTRSTELLSNPEAMQRLAYRLFSLQGGFKLEDVAGFLMRRDQLSERVSHKFMEFFNFSGTRLDAALREFLQHVCLTGESSQRAKILNHFSGRYHECNPSLFNSADEIHALTCSIILLNTDLHGYNSGRKMSSREFVNNLAHTHYSFDRNMLKALYASIKQNPFQYQNRTILEERGEERHARSNGSVRLSRAVSIKSSTLFINPEEQVDYKHGWLLRKSVYDSDGKKTPIGRRGWQMFYATVRGMVLYLHKDEKGFEGSRHGCFHNCVLLHHSIAEVPRDYGKRQHVFRLRTANFGEQLFQTSEPNEVGKWIKALNYVAAAFSTPVLPAPVGSSAGTVVFHKPTMPSVLTSLSLNDQLKSHRERLGEMEERLVKLRGAAPSLKAKGKPVYDYFYKERYLDKERERYATYIASLEEKMNSSSQHCRTHSLVLPPTVANQDAITPSSSSKGEKRAMRRET